MHGIRGYSISRTNKADNPVPRHSVWNVGKTGTAESVMVCLL